MCAYPTYNVQTVTWNTYFYLALTNNTDPDEMPHYAAFHLGITDCQIVHFGG